MRKVLHEPWRTFFEALDQEISSPCDLHCFGGFVLTEHYGVARPTIDVDVQGLTRMRLLAFERHDLVLAKLARNTDRDREDVVALARGPGLNTDVLRSRYQDELRPTLGRPDREDLTLELWIEMILETTGEAPTS